MSIPSNRRHALVVGASLSGLLAARVLAEHYAHVTIIERDVLPDAPAHRRHVPQSRHYHSLLGSGRELLCELFPGIDAELAAAGARFRDTGSGVWRVVGGQRHERSPIGRASAGCSRVLIEHLVRRRVLRVPGVCVLGGAEALGLLPRGSGCAVGGLRIRQHGVDSDLPADLVIDCSGRGSRVPAWLEAMGFLAPPVDEMRIDARYRTRCFRLPPGRAAALRTLFVTAVPGIPRYGVIGYVEGETWMCSLGGLGGQTAPADLEGFLAFARSLAVPDLYELLREAEPIDEACAFGLPSNLRRRYEGLEHFPQGLLVMGDAVCSFNPTYGQGMTVGAQQALRLRDWLALPAATARDWFASIATVIDRPWSIVTGGDALALGLPAARRGLRGWINRYLARFHRAAARDAVLSAAFLQVSNLKAAPASLLHPRLAWRVVVGGVSPRARAAQPLASGGENSARAGT